MRRDDHVFVAHMVEFARKAHERVASRVRRTLTSKRGAGSEAPACRSRGAEAQARVTQC